MNERESDRHRERERERKKNCMLREKRDCMQNLEGVAKMVRNLDGDRTREGGKGREVVIEDTNK